MIGNNEIELEGWDTRQACNSIGSGTHATRVRQH